MRQAAIDKSQNASKGAEVPAVEEEAYEGKEVHGEGEEEEIEVDDDIEMKVGDSTKMQSMITDHHIKFNQGSMPLFFRNLFALQKLSEISEKKTKTFMRFSWNIPGPIWIASWCGLNPG